MSQEVKHSELPFRVFTDPRGTCITNKNSRTICDFFAEEGDHKYKNDKMNAKFIVRACNSHYELLETLKYLRDECYVSGDNATTKIHAAIDNAEGK